jgi:hypothetical protein
MSFARRDAGNAPIGVLSLTRAGVRLVVLVLSALVIAVFAASAGAAEPADVNWPSYLPALPGPNKPQPHSVPYCKKPTSRCVDTEVQRLRALQKRLRCMHRAVFATTYLELTKVFRRTIHSDPHFFQFPRYLYTEAERGRPVPPAWQIAFDTARSGEVNAGQDMLLGINAHVQNDMPFVVAALGTHAPNGTSRKPDHDRVNKILNAAYQQVVDAVANRYDPLLKTTNASWDPLDDIGGIEMVKGWREGVWHNAERLLNGRTKAERDQVAGQIQTNAATWARLMAAPQQPGYRASRDAYCRAKLAKGA